MKFGSRQEWLDSIASEHRRLVELLATIPRRRYLEAGVWGDEWNIRDLLAHLTEWEQMFLTWFRAGQKGELPELPAPGFRWNQTPALNRAIQERYRDKPIDQVWEDFETSYDEIFSLAQRLTEHELMTPGHFSWTGSNPLTTYLGANTTSHYRTATKILRRWLNSRPESRPKERRDPA